MNQRPRAVILKFCLGLIGPVYTFFFLHSCVVSVEVSCASGDEVSRTEKDSLLGVHPLFDFLQRDILDMF